MTTSGPIPPSDPNQPPPGTPPPGAPLNYSTPPGGAYMGPTPDKDSMTMAMLCHLLAIFTGFLGPLIIWLMKKDTSPFVDDQGKEALNFWITLTIILVICGATAVFCVPAIIGGVAWVCGLVFSIMGAMKANQGIAYRYPINFRFIK